MSDEGSDVVDSIAGSDSQLHETYKLQGEHTESWLVALGQYPSREREHL